MPAVSVIVPNYNHARFLRKRIESILAQTFQDFELILLDDCSTDESKTILSEYASGPRVRLEFNEVNSGTPFRQWNKGVRMAHGKYVWIAESDDYADPRLLERLVPVLDADPRLAFAYCRSWCVTGERPNEFLDLSFTQFHTSRWGADFRADGREECRNYLVRCNTITNTSGVVFPRATYEQVGGADERLRLCGDWKLWAAMALTGGIAYLAEPMNYVRFHSATVRSRTRQSGLDVPEYLGVICWIAEQAKPPESVLGQARRDYAWLWLSALVNPYVPHTLRRTILRKVRAFDPHPISSAAFAVAKWIRAKILTRIWYAGLNLTYRARHATGLTRDGLSRVKTRFGLGRNGG